MCAGSSYVIRPSQTLLSLESTQRSQPDNSCRSPPARPATLSPGQSVVHAASAHGGDVISARVTIGCCPPPQTGVRPVTAPPPPPPPPPPPSPRTPLDPRRHFASEHCAGVARHFQSTFGEGGEGEGGGGGGGFGHRGWWEGNQVQCSY